MAGKGAAPGERRGGRKPGVPNKVSASVKAALEEAYAALGGDNSFVEWAAKNPNLFYKDLWGKMLPMNIEGNVNHNINWPLPKTELDK